MYFSLPGVTNRDVWAKLKQQTKTDRQRIEHQEETNKELKNGFLLAQIKGTPRAPASTSKSGTGNGNTISISTRYYGQLL